MTWFFKQTDFGLPVVTLYLRTALLHQVQITEEGESCARAASLLSPTASCCASTSAPGTRPAWNAPCVWARSVEPVTAGTACSTASTTMKSKISFLTHWSKTSSVKQSVASLQQVGLRLMEVSKMSFSWAWWMFARAFLSFGGGIIFSLC